ncbi:MAG: beta-hydroxyacyl-ACP dehydratase [Bacteriovoracaceae bacterium]|nr:beta-hydroxyacyl-ACP dehydratase [Bacteriovoracaceae bacterium]
MLFNREQVLKFLPHRDPFLFIDSVESIEGGEGQLIDGEVLISLKELIGLTAVAKFKVREDMEVFTGHFPKKPVLPGVLQIEMMAQASIFVVSKLYADFDNVNLDVALLKVEEAKFRKPILPGMDLTIRSTCKKARGTIMTFMSHIFAGNELMSEASVLAIVDFKEESKDV